MGNQYDYGIIRGMHFINLSMYSIRSSGINAKKQNYQFDKLCAFGSPFEFFISDVIHILFLFTIFFFFILFNEVVL